MKKLLFLLALFACGGYRPIEYSLDKDGNNFYTVKVRGDQSESMDTIRARAFDIATRTCGYTGTTSHIYGINESNASYPYPYVHLVFYCM
jgi:hypothetical protein